MKQLIILLLLFSGMALLSQNFPLKLNRVDDDASVQNGGLGNSFCESRVFVRDERPVDCTFGINHYMYPVFIEEFYYKQELPNNWEFTPGYTNDDHYEGGNEGATWLGNAYANNNVYTNNGIGYFEWKKEDVTASPNGGVGSKNYNFTGAMLYSIFRLRQGVFEAKIKLPENANFFPAYWLRGKEEIDVFEFADGNPSGQNICDTYHHMKMTLHGYRNQTEQKSDHCSRGRKFQVASDFFDSYHIYKCVWTDYKVDIYLDNKLVGTASKYYDGPYVSPGVCHNATGPQGVPLYHRDCNWLSTATDCLSRIWVPNFPDFWNGHYECIVHNKVDKDINFPSPFNPMQIITSMTINHSNNNAAATRLYDEWDNYGTDDKRIAIDYIKIYQPLDCGTNKYVCTMNDYKTLTGNTNFLTGATIQIGNTINCGFLNPAERQSNGYFKFPLHVLATDEIRFIDDAVFADSTYLRAEIIDCSGGFDQYQRGGQEPLFLTDEEIAEMEKRQNDSLMANDPAVRDSVNAYNERMRQEAVSQVKSQVDNGAITVYPNPADDILYIDMPEEDYFDLERLEILDKFGLATVIEKSRTVNVSKLVSDVYQLRFTFTHGMVVVKNFVRR